MSFSGGIDLSALANQAQPPSGQASGGASYVIDVTEANLQDVLQRSAQYVVVLHLWSARSPDHATFSQTLVTAVNKRGGRLQLANVDIDANPRIAQAFQVQSVPFVLGVIGGRPVPLFQSTVGEAELEQVFDELVTLATQNGITGTAEPQGAEPEPEEEQGPDPRFVDADAALETGDFDAAIAAYERLIAQNPADDEAVERLAGVKLIQRVSTADLEAARAAAADAPDDLDAQLLVADLDVSGGHVEDAFDRLVKLIARTREDDRERVRLHLIELFTVVGAADPRVAAARRALASVLF